MSASSKGNGTGRSGTGTGDLGNASPSTDTRREPRQEARGQQVSRERGAAQRSKKNPGKRATQGGGAR